MLVVGGVGVGHVLAHVVVAEVDALAGVEAADEGVCADSIRQCFKQVDGGLRDHNGW